MKLKSNQPKASAEQVVKDIRRATRRHYSTEDKVSNKTSVLVNSAIVSNLKPFSVRVKTLT